MDFKGVDWGHFTRGLQPSEATALFKKSVGLVAFSISSYCNRQCSYCPNVIADRKTTKNFMSDALFSSILRQLASIDYDGDINITRYNEPLADKDYVLSRLRNIRAALPQAHIQIYTNGDYVDRTYLDELEQVGTDVIVMTVHAGAGGKTDFESLVAEQERRIADLGVQVAFEGDTMGDRYRTAAGKVADRMRLVINAHDFYRGAEHGDAWAFDRGGSLPIPKTFRRQAPCLVLFTEMNIEWDGTLLPCCQIHNDVPEHKQYELGKLTPESDMFLAWTSINYIRWRTKLYSFDLKDAPCTTCTYGMPNASSAEYFERTTKVVQDALRKLGAQSPAA